MTFSCTLGVIILSNGVQEYLMDINCRDKSINLLQLNMQSQLEQNQIQAHLVCLDSFGWDDTKTISILQEFFRKADITFGRNITIFSSIAFGFVASHQHQLWRKYGGIIRGAEIAKRLILQKIAKRLILHLSMHFEKILCILCEAVAILDLSSMKHTSIVLFQNLSAEI